MAKGSRADTTREKVITILMKIWARPPRDLHLLQREGLKLLSHLPRKGPSSQRFGGFENGPRFHEPVPVPPEPYFRGSSGRGLRAARCAATRS